MGNSILKVENIDVFYGRIQVIWDVSFNVRKGELLAIIGANGAGKTTLLKSIMGFLHPGKGTIIFQGKKIEQLSTYQIAGLGISLVPEGRQLFRKMTVLENLKAGAYLKGIQEDSLEYVFNLFSALSGRKNQYAGTLSGGESQMLAIGRALMSKPKLLLLDEPSLGLAPKLVISLFQTVRKLNEQGITVVIVEQHVHQALEIAHRAYLLENGSIILEATGSEMLNSERVKKAYLGV